MGTAMANKEFVISVVAPSSECWLAGRRLLPFFGLVIEPFLIFGAGLIAIFPVRLMGPWLLEDIVYENGLASVCPPVTVDKDAGTLVNDVSVPLLLGG
jgi:hypothetical protein